MNEFNELNAALARVTKVERDRAEARAADPDALPRERGIFVTVEPSLSTAGLPRVTIEGPSSDAVVAYVRKHWGDDDSEWFVEHVMRRVEQVGAVPA